MEEYNLKRKISDEEHERLKGIIRKSNRLQARIGQEISDIFEKIIEQIEEKRNNGYDGWLDPRDRYSP